MPDETTAETVTSRVVCTSRQRGVRRRFWTTLAVAGSLLAVAVPAGSASATTAAPLQTGT
jgi:hypothetical protein